MISGRYENTYIRELLDQFRFPKYLGGLKAQYTERAVRAISQTLNSDLQAAGLYAVARSNINRQLETVFAVWEQYGFQSGGSEHARTLIQAESHYRSARDSQLLPTIYLTSKYGSLHMLAKAYNLCAKDGIVAPHVLYEIAVQMFENRLAIYGPCGAAAVTSQLRQNIQFDYDTIAAETPENADYIKAMAVALLNATIDHPNADDWLRALALCYRGVVNPDSAAAARDVARAIVMEPDISMPFSYLGDLILADPNIAVASSARASYSILDLYMIALLRDANAPGPKVVIAAFVYHIIDGDIPDPDKVRALIELLKELSGRPKLFPTNWPPILAAFTALDKMPAPAIGVDDFTFLDSLDARWREATKGPYPRSFKSYYALWKWDVKCYSMRNHWIFGAACEIRVRWQVGDASAPVVVECDIDIPPRARAPQLVNAIALVRPGVAAALWEPAT